MRIHVDQDTLDAIDLHTEVRDAEQNGWDYRLPGQFQDEVTVTDYQPLSDQGWDYVLPETFRY